jgi:hypothetical protein
MRSKNLAPAISSPINVGVMVPGRVCARTSLDAATLPDHPYLLSSNANVAVRLRRGAAVLRGEGRTVAITATEDYLRAGRPFVASSRPEAS